MLTTAISGPQPSEPTWQNIAGPVCEASGQSSGGVIEACMALACLCMAVDCSFGGRCVAVRRAACKEACTPPAASLHAQARGRAPLCRAPGLNPDAAYFWRSKNMDVGGVSWFKSPQTVAMTTSCSITIETRTYITANAIPPALAPSSLADIRIS